MARTMTDIQTRLNVTARCTACSKLHTAWQLDDGSTDLIGQGAQCECGGNDFRSISSAHE